MKIYKQFFNTSIHTALCNYAYSSSYSKIQDDIYNFRGINVEGPLRNKVEKVFREYNLTGALDTLRIQRIDKNFKIATAFHTHGDSLIENVVCFLNDNYSGGEFEYMDYNIQMITPESNTALIFPPELPHRVNLVTEGTRYTLVAFLAKNPYISKQDKTVI